jgi:AcrR family transcriptional regulator
MSTEPGERRRYDLLEAAYTLIGERGLEGLRTRDIAARAGVNISTLHYYFGTKETLLVALIEHTRGKFIAAASVQSSLRDHFEGALRTFQTTPHLSAVLQELALRGQRDAVTRVALAEMHNGWNGQVAALIRQEMRNGKLRPDLDPVATARVVTSFILGAMVQLGVNPEAFDFRELAGRLERFLHRTDRTS